MFNEVRFYVLLIFHSNSNSHISTPLSYPPKFSSLVIYGEEPITNGVDNSSTLPSNEVAHSATPNLNMSRLAHYSQPIISSLDSKLSMHNGSESLVPKSDLIPNLS